MQTVKNFLVKYRYSSRPAKKLLFMWLSKDMKSLPRKEIGIDFACAEMRNKNLFNTFKYIGVDIDIERLARGLKIYPDAEIINSDILSFPIELKGDVVQCIQTIGFNNLFDIYETIDTVKKLIHHTNTKGYLLFNIGGQATNYNTEIMYILNNHFSEVKVKEYGKFPKPINNSAIGHVLVFLISYAMHWIPLFRKSKDPKYYYFCKNRY